MLLGSGLRGALAAMMLVLLAGSGAMAADDGVWSVSKSSGEVWISTTGAQPASLKQEDTLKAGDTIRTGRNGRVLLVRGEETILIAPNSVIGVPTEKKDGLSTTILQQAGSILLEVEKKNVKHFEVETPYLAAVVKGTQFSVTVNAASTSVDVKRGQVEVSDFKSGQIALIMPGQAATSFANGKGGLSLSGSGTFNPVEQGKPRASSIDRIQVPKGGLPAPHTGEGKVIHALAPTNASPGKMSSASAQQQPSAVSKPAGTNVIHLSTALGEVQLNVNKATHGLAHGALTPGQARGASRDTAKDTAKDTVWSDSKSSVSTAIALGQTGSNASGGNGGGGNSSAAGGSTASAAGAATSAAAATVATVTGTATDLVSGANGVVNTAVGSGKGLANGLGLGNGNGNGNGNGGVGNGNGKGNAKH
jgi:hypothetical protein